VIEGSDAIFTFSRSVVLSQPLTIHYTMGGRAQSGSDYALSGIPGQVTIGAGQSSTTITLHSIADHMKERNETAVLSLTSDAAYKVPKRSKATVTIINGP
jgi:hypothetical protein